MAWNSGVSDGTPEGTVLLKDINPGSGNSYFPYNFTLFGSQLIFTAFDPTNGTELWVTDGTAEEHRADQGHQSGQRELNSV